MHKKRRDQRNSGVRWGDKNAFVLGQSQDLAAAAVVAAAGRRGLRLSKQQVHNIRSLARKAARAEFGSLRPVATADDRRKKEAEFKKLAKILGYQTSNNLIEEVAQAMRALGDSP